MPLTEPSVHLVLGLLLGLVLGSFANVVIYRLPRMLEQAWAQPQDRYAGPTLNLAVPGSHCPDCGTALHWQHNIPLLGFALLRGRCAHCRQAISWRYPLIEALSALLAGWCLWRHGLSAPALAWTGFSLTLLTLAAIDWDTTLLPDALTQPLTWSGLIVAALGWSGQSLTLALWGAVGGYLVLWTVASVFQLLTGKVGMGQGDFKLLAALGAWLGPWAGLSLILIASLSGLLVGLLLRQRGGLREGLYLPFGPFLVLAGLWVMMAGPLPGL